MKTKCAHCGTVFEAQRSTAVYCSATCRQRARRDRKAASESVAADAKAGKAEHELVAAVRQELEQASALNTVSGQLALQIARRVANPEESGISALSKELRTVLSAALEHKAPPPDETEPTTDEDDDLPDEVADARRRRDAAREAAGRA